MTVRVFVSLPSTGLAASGAARAEDDKVLNIYTGSDDIADDAVSRFELSRWLLPLPTGRGSG